MLSLYNFSHTKKKAFSITASRRISLAVRLLILASAIIFAAISAVTIFTLVSMGILPAKYFSIVVAGVVVLTAVGFLMFFVSKKHKVPAIIVSVILLIISGFLCLGLSYLFTTRGFFSQTKAREYYIEKYSVVVLKEDNFNTIQDLNGKTCASYFDTVLSYDQAFNDLKESVNFITEVEKTYVNAAFSLVNHKADFFLVNNSYIDLIDDFIKDFTEKIKIIHTIEIKLYDTIELSDVDVLNEPFNIFISGIDVEGDISTVSRSDVNMIVTVNPKTHKILLTGIPRDFYVQLHGTTGTKDKLTHSGIFGPKMTVKTVEDFLNININYYVRINFTSVVNLVNAIGGIYITPDFTFYRSQDGNDCYYYQNVTSWYNGACALRYARERKAYGTGDIHRVQNQQQVLTAIIDKLSSSEILKNYTSILAAVEKNFETNIPENKFYQLINNQLDAMPRWNVESYAMEGYNSHNQVYTYDLPETGEYNNYYYVMEPNFETVEIAKEKIKKAFAGE